MMKCFFRVISVVCASLTFVGIVFSENIDENYISHVILDSMCDGDKDFMILRNIPRNEIPGMIRSRVVPSSNYNPSDRRFFNIYFSVDRQLKTDVNIVGFKVPIEDVHRYDEKMISKSESYEYVSVVGRGGSGDGGYVQADIIYIDRRANVNHLFDEVDMIYKGSVGVDRSLVKTSIGRNIADLLDIVRMLDLDSELHKSPIFSRMQVEYHPKTSWKTQYSYSVNGYKEDSEVKMTVYVSNEFARRTFSTDIRSLTRSGHSVELFDGVGDAAVVVDRSRAILVRGSYHIDISVGAGVSREAFYNLLREVDRYYSAKVILYHGLAVNYPNTNLFKSFEYDDGRLVYEYKLRNAPHPGGWGVTDKVGRLLGDKRKDVIVDYISFEKLDDSKNYYNKLLADITRGRSIDNVGDRSMISEDNTLSVVLRGNTVIRIAKENKKADLSLADFAKEIDRQFIASGVELKRVVKVEDLLSK